MAKGNRPGGTYKVANSAGRVFNAVNKAPKGWVKDNQALTAPKGYTWYNNGKSRFSKDRQAILVKDSR